MSESVFEDKFNAREYIETYYPAFTEIDTFLLVAKKMHENPEGNYVIDAIAEETGTQHELIENVAVFDFYRVIVEHLLEEFPAGDARILDVGGGPTIYQHIGLCLIAEHITHSEYLEKNRQEVLLWLEKEEEAHIWDSYFTLVQQLFKTGQIPQILKRQSGWGSVRSLLHARKIQKVLDAANVDSFKHLLRTRVGTDVVHGDIFQADLALKNGQNTYDVVTSNFVAESATTELEQWRNGMKNLISHVRPGGYFVQTAIKNAHWYQVGKERLPAVAVDQGMISEICEREGCRVIYQKVLEGSDTDVVGYDGMIFTLAQKLK